MKAKLWPLVLQELVANRSRLWFLALCLALGTAGVSGVASFTGQVERAIEASSRQLFGGDVEISDIVVIDDDTFTRFSEMPGVNGAVRQSRMSAMAVAPKNGETALATVRAIEGPYPLVEGSVTLDPPLAIGSETGGAFVAEDLLLRLQIGLGDTITLAGHPFEVRSVIKEDLTQGGSFLSFAPLVIVRRQDATEAGLLSKTSRFRDSVTFLTSQATTEFVSQLKALPNFKDSMRVTSSDDEDRGPARALSNLYAFLSQVTLSTLLLICLGLATCLGELVRARRMDTAIYRVLGAPPQLPGQVLGGVVLAVCVSGVILGVLGGELLRLFVLAPAIGSLLPVSSASFSILQISWPSLVTAAVAPFLLVWPQIRSLMTTSPADVLRGTSSPAPAFGRQTLSVWLFPLLAGGLLLNEFVGASKVWWVGVVVFATNLILFALFRWALGTTLRHLDRRTGTLPLPLEIALGEIRSRSLTALLTMALVGIGLFFVSLTLFLRSDLAASVQGDITSKGKANVFFFDVQQSQGDGLLEAVRPFAKGPTESLPLLRARLVEIDGQKADLRAEEAGSERESRMLRREQNITWRDRPGPSEEVTETLHRGGLWAEGDPLQVSLEEGYAGRIGASLGSELVFSVSGLPLKLRVTSLREVNWQSFGLNFFVIIQPEALAGAPHQLLMSAHVPTKEKRLELQRAIALDFPNVSVLDATNIIDQVSKLTGSITQTSAFLSILLIAGGFLILLGTVLSTSAERRRNATVLRVLGSSSGLIGKALVTEFALIGSFSAAAGVVAAQLVTWLMVEQVFEFSSQWHLVPGLSLFFGAVLSTVALGYLSCRSVLTQKPAKIFRESL